MQIRATFLALAIASSALGAPPLTAIFPSSSVLPANHLKFYVHFAEPMREGVFLEHCRLLDEHGNPVSEPFRETELWSDDRQRLTLWLHPGRQKAGVNLNDEFGPVLEPGRRYTLVISGTWPTARGTPLGADLTKAFRAGARATAQLDPAKWRIDAPPAGTLQPLEVRFPAPLDRALLARCLRVREAGGAIVSGKAESTDDERWWRFVPGARWEAADYRLEVDAILEDLAGNSLARPFEVDLEGPPPRRTPPVVTIPFRPETPAP